MRFGRSNPRFYPTPNGKVPSITTVLSVLSKPMLVPWAANEAVDYIEANLQSAMYLEGMKRTEVIDFLTPARTAYKRKSEEALAFGEDMHSLCEVYMGLGITRVSFGSEALEKLFWAFHDWYKKHNVKPIAIEQVVIGEGYGGRVDLICEIDSFWMTKGWCKKNGVEYYKGIRKQRVVTLIDFKTGKGTYYPEWGLQVAAYRSAYNKAPCENIPCPDGIKGCEYCQYGTKVRHHGVLKFNKETLKVNYKDYTPEYETDLKSFLLLKDFYIAVNLGE